MTNTPSKFLRTSDLAKRWEMSAGTIANWRVRGIGPTFTRVGGAVRYALADIEAHEAAGRTVAVA